MGGGTRREATAGGIAGAVARSMVAPLDVIKIRMQVQREPVGVAPRSHYTGLAQAFKTIIREEGIKGLWRGTIPGVLLSVPYTSVQFIAFNMSRKAAGQTERNAQNPVVSFFSGAFAGVCATVVSYPFDLLRTVLAAQGEPKVYGGMTHAAWSIARSQGVKGFYKGLDVTIIEIIPYAAIQFAAYDVFNILLKKMDDIHPKQGFNSTQSRPLIAGFLSGIVSKFLTHPLDVAKKRFQIGGLARSQRYGRRIDQQSLVSPLAGPATAVTFFTFEFLMQHLP